MCVGEPADIHVASVLGAYNLLVHKCVTRYILVSLVLIAQVLPPSVAGLFAGLSVSGQPPSNVPPNAAHLGPPTAVVPAVQRHTAHQQKVSNNWYTLLT